MDVLKKVLGDILGGRVLDVATGEGGFVALMKENLKGYTKIIGIDIREGAIKAAQSTFARLTDTPVSLGRNGSGDMGERDNIGFVQMDAERLGFQDGSFDTVNISVSLHHLANIPKVLAEMKRVLKAGGRFVISEMYRDGQTEPQLTIVYIHHLAAEIDSALGFIHNETFTRKKLVDIVEGLGLRSVAFHDRADVNADPMDEAARKGCQDAIDRCIQRAEGLPNYVAFKTRGDELRQRLCGVGCQTPSVLIAVGEKR